MVYLKSFFGAAALFAAMASARPMPQDSALGIEVGVSAPDGTPITNLAELASQTAAEAAATAGVVANNAAPEAAATTSSSPAAYAQATTAPAYNAPSPSSAAPSHATTSVQYGSGSTPPSSEYNDCVQQCVSQHGAPGSVVVPAATPASGGSHGTGATHTVIVAPTQGVLRYVPFAVNASIGDTIEFKWNAKNHTVTKSDQLTPCNKTGNALFASGIQSAPFSFTQVVNTTEPVFFMCAIPSHCQKGMFGIINPPSAAGSPKSVAGMMPGWVKNNTDIATMSSYTTKATAGNAAAARWGGNMDVSALPEWSHPLIAENTMYMRTFLAANPDTLKEDGSIDLGNADKTPLMVPADISVAINNAGYGDAPAAGASPAIASSSGAAPSASAQATTPNGAMTSSPSIALGLVTALAAFLLL